MKSLFAALFLSLIAVSAQAATLTVNTTQQCGIGCVIDNDDKCSFGEAIATINTGKDNNDCQDSASEAYGNNDTIHLPDGATLEFQHQDHSSLLIGPTALPVIATSVTIRGHGAKLVRQDEPETQPMRFFEIASQVDNESNDPVDPSGPQIQVFWDETTFEDGNPDCTCVINDIPVKGDAAAPQAFLCPFFAFVCHSGGAGYIRGSGISATFDKTTFKNNRVRTDRAYQSPLGGAVFIDSGAFGMVNFSRSLFLGNKAPAGGAIYSGIGTQLSISDSTFAGNKAQVERDTSNDDDLDLDPVVDALDTADSKMGGAVYAEGPVSSINDSAFYANQAGVGGALALRGISTSILNSTFFKNSSEIAGGAIAAAPVPYNYRDLNGPAIPNTALSSFSQFAEQALARFGTSPTVAIEHATIVENTVGNGSLEVSAVSMGGGLANLGAGTVSLKNTILTDNTAVGGASGLNCYGNFLSLGRNDLHWPAADPSCVITHDAGAAPDLNVDPLLTACNEDKTTPGQASCDPDTASPMIGAAASCPVEDQHHKGRSADQCTVGAIEVDPPAPTVPEGSVCGNGTVEEGEACDEGEAHNSDEPDATCRTDCTAQRCGDGIVDSGAGEGCDGGVACFECTAEVVPSEGCGITKEDLLDPTLKTNDDLIARFGLPAVEKCLNVFGGGNCSLNPESQEDASPFVFLLLGIAGLTLPCVRRLGLFSRP